MISSRLLHCGHEKRLFSICFITAAALSLSLILSAFHKLYSHIILSIKLSCHVRLRAAFIALLINRCCSEVDATWNQMWQWPWKAHCDMLFTYVFTVRQNVFEAGFSQLTQYIKRNACVNSVWQLGFRNVATAVSSKELKTEAVR